LTEVPFSDLPEHPRGLTASLANVWGKRLDPMTSAMAVRDTIQSQSLNTEAQDN